MRPLATALAGVLVTTALTVGAVSSTGVAAAADSGTCPTAAGAYAGGTGTSNDPFQIATPEQLQLLRDTSADWNDAVLLTTDIDMGGCVWGTTLGDSRIAFWTGTFDGGGHVVSGLDIDLGNTDYAGFIARLGGGSIRGLGFTGDVSIAPVGTGSVVAYVGGLVGFTLVGRPISDSFATGDVTVNATATSSMDRDDADVTVQAGGLVGVLQGTVSNSYATGDVDTTATATATGSGVSRVNLESGGLVGWTNAVISNSYATGAVTSTLSATGGSSQNVSDARGGFLGWLGGGGGVSRNAWNITSSGLANDAANGPHAGITGLTTAQMQDFTTFGPTGVNWSITNGYSDQTTWSICPTLNSGFPFLSAFATAAACPDAAYAEIDSIDVGGTASSVVISGGLTASTADDTIYVVDDSTVLVLPPLATGADTASVLEVGSPIEYLAVTDDTIYVATRGIAPQFTGIISFPVGATGSPSPSASSALPNAPTAIAVGGQGTSSTSDDSVYVVAYNNSNGIYQLTSSLDDSSFVAFSPAFVQPGAIVVSGANTTSTTDDTVYVRGNGGGSGAFVEMTPSLDDSVARSPLGFGGSDFLLYDDSFLFSSYNLDRTAATADLDDSIAIQYSSSTGAVTDNGVWLAINGFNGAVGIGPVSSATKTSVLDLGYINGFGAGAAAASDRTFYVVGGGSVMSVVDKVSAGVMTPMSGAVGTTVTLPFTTASGRLVDNSMVTGVSWGGTVIPVSRVAGQNQVEVQVPNVPGTSDVVLELNGDDTLAMGSFTVASDPTPAPIPASAPQDVVAVGGDRLATVSWQAPASSGSFRVTTYQVEGLPSGTCVVSATTDDTQSCVVEDLVNGDSYVFRVRALTGAGWGAWSQPSTAVIPAQRSIMISGSRDGRQVRVEGVTTGLVGAEVRPWVRFPGQRGFTPGSSVRTVDTEGTFTWQRRTGKKVYVYFRADDDVRSNRLTISKSGA